jgi:hypothetical protein
MSEQNEDITTELGSYSVDDEDQLQPEETLEVFESDGQAVDPLDRGYSPPDTDRSGTLWGTTAYEQAHEETIDQRITQEVPDPDTAYGAPDNESGLDTERVGGDDPDAIDPEDDWYGEPELAEDEVGDTDDLEDEAAVSDDAEQGRPITPAEESAMRVVEE